MSDGIFKNQPNVTDQKKAEEELPEALRGKSSGEIYKALQAAHIQEMAETQNDFSRRLEQIALQPQVSSAPAPQQAPQTVQEQEPTFDLSNPEAYLDRAVAKRVAPIAQAMVQAGRESGRSIAQQKVSKEHWERFGKEIEMFVDSVSPQMQANPKIYDIAYKFVKGEHADELIKEGTTSSLKTAVKETLGELGFDTGDIDTRISARDQQRAEPTHQSLFASRSSASLSSVPRSGSEANSGSPRGKLTNEEKLMCEKFQMTPEDYLKYKEENTDIYSSLARERR